MTERPQFSVEKFRELMRNLVKFCGSPRQTIVNSAADSSLFEISNIILAVD